MGPKVSAGLHRSCNGEGGQEGAGQGRGGCTAVSHGAELPGLHARKPG